MSPPLLEMGPNEQAESRRCSVAENQRASSLSPLLLLDHELHYALLSVANCRRTEWIKGRVLWKYVWDLSAV